MALRRVLGSSSKYIQNYGRLIGSHGRSVSTPTNTKKQEFDYHMDLGGLGPARFATQEFNRLKNAQLQISRVLKATCWHMRRELWRSSGYYYRHYELVFEAVDADEVKFYQARVAVDSVDDRMWLKVYCVLDDEHNSLRQYHHLDNFFDE